MMMYDDYIVKSDEPILITGSNGFIGSRLVASLLSYGLENLRCFVRPGANLARLNEVTSVHAREKVRLFRGNLLSQRDCLQATDGVSVIYHLAAGIEKSFPGAFMNSVITTRNLLDAALTGGKLKRFVSISSFAVYSNMKMRRGDLLDETCEVEGKPELRHEAYCYGKVKQDELIMDYARRHGIPYVILRPGVVFGPGKRAITGRVGIDTFGVFLHMGGRNSIPLTYVDNCADAIALAGIKKGVEGEIFNIVDDDLPTSKQFLTLYKRNVKDFRSFSIPFRVSYFLCYLWEKYSDWSYGQLPPAFNRRRCAADWKGNRYTNSKLKNLLGWQPKVPIEEAMHRYFEYQRQNGEQK